MTRSTSANFETSCVGLAIQRARTTGSGRTDSRVGARAARGRNFNLCSEHSKRRSRADPRWNVSRGDGTHGAADPERGRWLPRLRTPNGFAISALYPPSGLPGAAPVGLLVECPVS